ncbi:MAG TPA: WbqC family protein [Bacteroidia bacterium]|nr:WbqC family protein [Bacteroidia bacterium]
MKKAVILQSNYIPWKGYFDLIHDADIFIFYDVVKYTKNDWRNRNTIYTKNGKQWLSIPIEASAVKLTINEVEIKDQNWIENHYKSLSLGYKKAPYFNQLDELLSDYYTNYRWKLLSDFNQYIIKDISKRLGLITIFRNAEEFNLEGNKIEKLINILKEVNATTYITGPAAKDYLNGMENLFTESGISLEYKAYPAYPAYRQLTEPFENSISILDLVANLSWEEIPAHIWGKSH